MDALGEEHGGPQRQDSIPHRDTDASVSAAAVHGMASTQPAFSEHESVSVTEAEMEEEEDAEEVDEEDARYEEEDEQETEESETVAPAAAGEDGQINANATAATAATAANGEKEAEAATGMRREWNFSLGFAHKQARVLLQCSPQWEPTFIDPDSIDCVRQLDRDVRHTPLIPCLRYTDFSAVVGAGRGGAGRGTRTSTGGARLSATTATAVDEAGAREQVDGSAAGEGTDLFRGSYDDVAADWWLEKAKHVELLYSHVPPDVTLERYCKDCVHHVLKDPQIVAVDQETDRTHLHLGNKLDCPYRLGGYRSFHFRCRLQNRSQLIDDSIYAIGTIVHQRGYLALVRCAEEEELEGYLSRLFLPAFATTAANTNTPTTAAAAAMAAAASSAMKLQLDAEVDYHEVTSIVLAEQQQRYGELRYVDRDAAVSFTLPMHPMRIRPDFSPAKTVGVGSIACMTVELNIYERLIDDTAIAELSGMPRFKVNPVVLCLDVEDVARMGYPRVISTEAYSRFKTERLMDVFADAKSVGQPTTVPVGGRVGRSRTTTFTYEALQGLSKNMTVSTLVGNHGVTVLYLTRLGGGAFDTHLYLFQQLLSSIAYHPITGAGSGELRPLAAQTATGTATTATAQRGSHEGHVGVIKDRHTIPNTRLLEPDLPRAYARGCAAAAASAMREAENAMTGRLIATESASGAHDSTPPRGSPASPLPIRGSGGMSDVSGEISPVTPGSPLSVVDHSLTPAAREALQQHMALLRQSNDGRVEGATIVVTIPPEEGGAGREENPTTTANAARRKPRTSDGSGQTGNSASSGLVAGQANGDDDADDADENESSAGPVGSEDGEAELAGKAAAAPADQSKRIRIYATADDEDTFSLHSDSLISVSSIPHLHTTDDVDRDERLATGNITNATTTRAAPPTAPAATTAMRTSSSREEQDGDTKDPFADLIPLQPRRSVDSEATSAPRRRSNPAKRVSVATGEADRHEREDDISEDVHCSRDASTHSTPGSKRDSHTTNTERRASVDVSTNRSPQLSRAAEEEDARNAAQETAIRDALADADAEGDATFQGSSLCDVYMRCCALQQCKPNSYLLRKLPNDSKLTTSVEELDLTSNYLGHNGLVAVLNLIEYLPHVRAIYFTDMSLDNTDVEHISRALARHPSVEVIHLDNNPRITLPATRDLTKLVRGNPRLKVLSLAGTKLGDLVIQRLEKEMEDRQALIASAQRKKTDGVV